MENGCKNTEKCGDNENIKPQQLIKTQILHIDNTTVPVTNFAKAQKL